MDGAEMSALASIIDRARPQQIRFDPFPHLVLKEALPAALYASLAETFPPLERVAGTTTFKNNHLYLKSARDVIGHDWAPPLWQEFFARHCSRAFYLQVIDLWKDVLTTSHPDLEECYAKTLDRFTTGLRQPGDTKNPANLAADIQLDCQFGVNSPVRRATSVRGPHIDSRYKLFAALLYFRLADDHSEGGELEFYRFRDERLNYRIGAPIRRGLVREGRLRALNRIDPAAVDRVRTFPYEANTLIMWLNMPYAVHGVSPRQPTDCPRRYVNFLGESYVGKRDGFFETSRRLLRLPRLGGSYLA
jgi:hypothetical protein